MLISVQSCVPVPLPAEPDACSLAAASPSGAWGAEVAPPGGSPSVTQRPAARMFSSVAGPIPPTLRTSSSAANGPVRLNVVQDRTGLRRPDAVDGVEEIRACRVDIGTAVRPRLAADGT